MNTAMDLTGVQQALQELTQLVDGWSASGRVDALERDLALEKLRRVYDALRFAPSGDALPEVPATAEPVGDVGAEPVSEAFEMPEALDLGEVLSLDPHSVADPEFQQAVPLDKVSEEPPLAAAVAGVEPEPEAEPADEPVADEPVAGLAPAAGAEAPAVAEPEAAAEPEPVPAAVAEPIAGREPAAADVPTPASESAPASESGPAAEPAVAPVSETQPIPETQPEPELRPAPDAEPSFVQPSAPAPAPETASETASERPHTAAPTLFGPEENANLRHRHKQRVIMSLYGNDAPSVKPQAPAVPEPTPAPAADRVAPAPERPSDERRAGRPSIAEVFGRRVETGPSAAFGRDLSEAPAAPADGTDAGESAEADPVVHGSFADELAAAAPGAVLGEVINHDVQTLADTIAPPRDRASELLRNEPVTDLRRAIGINDRFLLIRDLFGGDGAAYEAAIDALNGFDNLDDCMIYIAEHYAWNPNSDGAVLLMELLERKYL